MKITGVRHIIGTRAAMVCVTVSVCAGAGVAAAAATDNAPWQDQPTATAPALVESLSDASTSVESAVPTSDAATSEVTVTDAVSVETAAPTTASPEPASTDPASTAPATTEPATTEPATTAPLTTPRPDTPVPQGIELGCAVQDAAVSCSWSGGVVPGFSRFLVLRGDGRVVFMSGDPAANGYIDQSVPAGSYSYVVVAVDGNSKALVHSNPVFVQIGAAG